MEISFFFCYLALAYFIFKIFDGRRRERKIRDFQSRFILITGCDSGFGRDLAKRLDKLGCHVFAGCLTEKGEDSLRKACSKRLVTIWIDVANHESVSRAYRLVCQKLPDGKGLWGIVNNAGIAGNNGPLEWLQLSDYQQVLNVNTLGMVDITTTFLPLVKKEHGRVVNMGLKSPYNLSKYAAEAFSDSLRRQMKVFKVSVHIVEPGFHKTNIVNMENTLKRQQMLYERCPREVKDEFGKQYLDEWNENIKSRFTSITEDLEPVIETYEHALLACHPRARYVVGNDANILVLLQALPTVLGDFLLSLVGRRNRVIPIACQNKH